MLLRTILALSAMLLIEAAAAAGPNDPVRFAPVAGSGFKALPVSQTYVVRQSDNLTIREKWTFTRPEILIACGPTSLNVVRVGDTYAALNGHTSGLAEVYTVEERNGRKSGFLRTRNNQDFRDAKIVVAESTNPQIGEWWGVLNQKLRVVPLCR